MSGYICPSCGRAVDQPFLNDCKPKPAAPACCAPSALFERALRGEPKPAESASVPILWHAQKMSEMVDKLAAAELKAGEYERALEKVVMYACDADERREIARKVLAAHRRGGES